MICMGTIFSTDDIRGRLGDGVTVEYAWNIGKAFSEWLPDQGTIAIVRSENANQEIIHALIEGMLLQGRDVVDARVGGRDKVADVQYSATPLGIVLVGHDDAQDIETIALFDESGVIVPADNGLDDIKNSAESGNFLPAVEKGKLVTL